LQFTIPEFNISLPQGLFGSGSPDVSTLLDFLGSDKLTSLAAILKGLGKEEDDNPLTQFGNVLSTIAEKGDFWTAIKSLLQVLPSDIATPTGLRNFLTSLTTAAEGSASPFEALINFMKSFPAPTLNDSGTGNLISDLIASMPSAAGSDNPLAGFLNLLSFIPSPSSNTTGNPLAGLTSLISALPTSVKKNN
jgi:hypothetical protein